MSYSPDKNEDIDAWKVIDPSGMFEFRVFAVIDLWIKDEDDKHYVILSYEPSRGFAGNLNRKVLERIGLRDFILGK